MIKLKKYSLKRLKKPQANSNESLKARKKN
jgi:hypothetical protein